MNGNARLVLALSRVERRVTVRRGGGRRALPEPHTTARCRHCLVVGIHSPPRWETVAASKWHFGAAPGAAATAPCWGNRPLWLLLGFRRVAGRTKAKASRASEGFLMESSRGRSSRRRPGPGSDVKPDLCGRPPAFPRRFWLGVAQPGKAPGLPLSPLSRAPAPSPRPGSEEGAEWATPSGDTV